jgi:dienelactone hydrolase
VFHALLSAAVWVAIAPGIPRGAAMIEIEVVGRPIRVYTYTPPTYRDGPLLIVFHGLARNAEEYRDFARELADQAGAIVAAPEFDEDRFPYQKYTRGGLRRADGSIAPRSDWTWTLVPELAEALRRRLGKPQLPYYMIGHSAGGQVVGRLSGLVSTGARRYVAANPGAYLWPSRDEPFPYGFGGLPHELSDDDAIRRYLAVPLTIYVGTGDNVRDIDLDKTPEADRQGRNRLDRGRKVFATAQALARARGWPFGWRMVEANHVGHDARAMFDNAACRDALFGPDAATPDRKDKRQSCGQ